MTLEFLPLPYLFVCIVTEMYQILTAMTIAVIRFSVQNIESSSSDVFDNNIDWGFFFFSLDDIS